MLAAAALVAGGAAPLGAAWSQNGTAGPFLYTDTANWAGGTIDNTFSSDPTTNLNVTWSSDYTVSSGINLSYASGSSITFRSDSSTARTLVMNGNWIRSGSGGGTITLGTVANPLVLNLNGATRTFGGGGANFNIYAKITGSGGISLGGGTGYTYLYNDTSDFTGPVSFNRRGGSFSSIANVGGGPSSLGAPTTAANGLISVSDATSYGELRFTGNTNQSSDRNWSWNLSSSNGLPFVLAGTGNLTLTGNWTYNSSSIGATINASSANLSLLGVVSEGGSATRHLTFTGGGTDSRTITLGSSNTYSGKTSLHSVTLVAPSLKNAGVASSLGDATGDNAVIAIGSGTSTGRLTYTGAGDTTNRVIDLAATTGGVYLSQSGTGHLLFTSSLTATGSGAKTLTLEGSTAGTAELGGAVVNSSGGATSLRKLGTGKWTLSGSNGFTGDLTIGAGTLEVGGAGTLGGGSYAGAISNAGTLSFASSSAQTVSGIISGAGTLVKSGAGTLTLSASNTFTGGISLGAGTLAVSGRLGGGSYAGAIVNDGTLAFTGSAIQTLTGAISGSGTLSKSGSGTINLRAANSHAGGTQVANGTLVVGNASALGSGGVTLSGGTLALGVANALGSNALTFSGGRLLLHADSAVGGEIALTGAAANASISVGVLVDYLVVGGGGGGGARDSAGGGGGGGVLSNLLGNGAPLELVPGSYSVTVGAGGAGAVGPDGGGAARGEIGGTSAFHTVSALGGGGGGGYSIEGSSGATGGGSGRGKTTAAAGTAGQGYAGGGGTGGANSAVDTGGGGGGAGEAGQAGVASSKGGDGGDGLAVAITGTSTYYGGGGGGSPHRGATTLGGGLGGLGGGGNAATSNAVAPSNGQANTGGGGGAARSDVTGRNNGGSGGSGVVIIRYLGSAQATGGTVSAGTGAASGYTLHTFNSTGNQTLDFASLSREVSANLSGAGGFTFGDAGRTLVLSGNNTFSGGAVVSAGTLVAASATALGSGSVSLASPGTLRLGFSLSSDLTLANALTGQGVVEVATSGAGALRLDGLSGFSGTLRLASGRFDAAGYAGDIVFAGGTLANPSAFSGDVVLASGTTLVASAGLPSRVVLAEGSSIDFTGAGPEVLSSTILLGGGTLLNASAFTGTLAVDRALTLGPSSAGGAAGATVEIRAGASVTLQAGFTNALRYTGGTLSGLANYTGSLTVAGSSANLNLGTADNPTATTASFTLSGGGRLSGQGSVGTLSVGSGGVLAPGNSPGLIVASTTILGAGGAAELEFLATEGTMGPPQIGVDHDGVESQVLDLTGLGGANRYTLNLVSLATSTTQGTIAGWDSEAEAGYGWDIYTYSQSLLLATPYEALRGGNLTSLFVLNTTGFVDETVNSISSARFTIIDTGSSLRLVYSPIPEPSTYGFVLGGLALAAAATRRRRR